MNAQAQKDTAQAIIELAMAYKQMDERERALLTGYCQGLTARLPQVETDRTDAKQPA